MKIKKACFVCSRTLVEEGPKDGRPEYAFLGRSNVGKSSLINLLTGQKRLALTSSTPGKTRMINYFLINEKWYLVDLPGYGYAQRGKKKRKCLQAIIDDYLVYRQALTCLFLLIDSRHIPQKSDLERIHSLGKNGIPFAIVFTKIDKLSCGQLSKNEKVYRNTLLETWEELPPIFHTSSERKIGKEEILTYIEEVNKTF